jgi:hypothetical protein
MNDEQAFLSAARKSARRYEKVFRESPDVELMRLPGGQPAAVFSSWLWLFPTGRDDRWLVRVKPQDPWFFRYKCLRELSGTETEHKGWSEAMVKLLQHETHRRFHQVEEDESHSKRPSARASA